MLIEAGDCTGQRSGRHLALMLAFGRAEKGRPIPLREFDGSKKGKQPVY